MKGRGRYFLAALASRTPVFVEVMSVYECGVTVWVSVCGVLNTVQKEKRKRRRKGQRRRGFLAVLVSRTPAFESTLHLGTACGVAPCPFTLQPSHRLPSVLFARDMRKFCSLSCDCDLI